MDLDTLEAPFDCIRYINYVKLIEQKNTNDLFFVSVQEFNRDIR